MNDTPNYSIFLIKTIRKNNTVAVLLDNKEYGPTSSSCIKRVETKCSSDGSFHSC